jgi:hypothetical protein
MTQQSPQLIQYRPTLKRLFLLYAFYTLFLWGGLTACSDNPATGEGTDAGGDGGSANTVLSLTQEQNTIAHGDTYNMPLGAADVAISLFDVQVDRLILKNQSTHSVTIKSISLVGEGDAQAEEWALLDGESNTKELAISDLIMESDDILSFQIRFSPVIGKARAASLSISYDDGGKQEFLVDIKGSGAPTSEFFSGGKLVLQKLLGDHRERENAVAMTMDGNGAVYFAADLEHSNHAISIARMNADGSLAWAKAFNGPFTDRIGNGGGVTPRAGVTNAISWGDDGYLYVVGNYSWSFANSSFYTWVAKIHPSTGDLVWSKLWSRVETISGSGDGSYATGINATGDDHVFVAGSTNGSDQSLLLALQKSDGAVIFARQIEFAVNSSDRCLTLAFDGKENLFLGGQYAGNSGYIVRMKGATGAAPIVDWARRIEYGTGSMVNALAIDNKGNVFFSGVVPAKNELAFNWGSLDDKGALRWMKAIPTGNDTDTAVGVLLYEAGNLFIGGAIGDSGWDIALGDALLVSADSTTGERNWSTFYYNGSTELTRTTHRINGLVTDGNTVTMALEARTGDLNAGRYWGYWYDGQTEAKDYAPLPKISEITPVITAVGEGANADGYLRDITDSTKLSAKYTDAEDLVWDDAVNKTTGDHPSAEIMIMALELEK